MTNRQEKLLFLHIPKTAGMTLQHIIAQNYAQEAIFELEGPRARELLEEFKALPEEKRNQYRAIAGHMHFGVHEYLTQPYSYVTILRNPIDRVISAYHFVLSSKDHPMHRNLVESGMGLRECVENGIPPMCDNEHVRYIAGLSRIGGIPFGGVSREHLELAKKNLKEEFSVVGISEEFDKTLLLIARKFEWKHLSYQRQNITSKRPSLQQIDRDTLRVIEDYNHLDMELYELGCSLFNKIIKLHGLGFKRDLVLLQWKNKARILYSKKGFGVWKNFIPWRVQKAVHKLLRN